MKITSAEWRDILALRNHRNKFAVPMEARPERISIALRQLRKKGYIVWLDDGYVKHGSFPIKCDIYLLTPSGSRLCDENGINKRD